MQDGGGPSPRSWDRSALPRVTHGQIETVARTVPPDPATCWVGAATWQYRGEVHPLAGI